MDSNVRQTISLKTLRNWVCTSPVQVFGQIDTRCTNFKEVHPTMVKLVQSTHWRINIRATFDVLFEHAFHKGRIRDKMRQKGPRQGMEPRVTRQSKGANSILPLEEKFLYLPLIPANSS